MPYFGIGGQIDFLVLGFVRLVVAAVAGVMVVAEAVETQYFASSPKTQNIASLR